MLNPKSSERHSNARCSWGERKPHPKLRLLMCGSDSSFLATGAATPTVEAHQFTIYIKL